MYAVYPELRVMYVYYIVFSENSVYTLHKRCITVSSGRLLCLYNLRAVALRKRMYVKRIRHVC